MTSRMWVDGSSVYGIDTGFPGTDRACAIVIQRNPDGSLTVVDSIRESAPPARLDAFAGVNRPEFIGPIQRRSIEDDIRSASRIAARYDPWFVNPITFRRFVELGLIDEQGRVL